MIPTPPVPVHTEDLRLAYPLTPESVVVDAGGYKGDWAADIFRLYGCTVHVYEPVSQFYSRIVQRFAGSPNIVVHHAGLSDRDGTAEFGIQNDSTGRFAGSPDRERVWLMDVAPVVEKLGEVALMKLNIEGSEFLVVQRLIETGLIHRIENLQVQWHSVIPDAAKRYDALQSALAKWHALTFDSGWTWQNWMRK